MTEDYRYQDNYESKIKAAMQEAKAATYSSFGSNECGQHQATNTSFSLLENIRIAKDKAESSACDAEKLRRLCRLLEENPVVAEILSLLGSLKIAQ